VSSLGKGGLQPASRLRRRSKTQPGRHRSCQSPNTPSCRTATPVRWSRPMGQSTGFVYLASTRRACLGPCSTAVPTFRLGPFGINVPAGHAYEPGTNTLLTSWTSRTGWATVREALTMGPRRGEDRVTPHTRPPADEDADHMLVRAVTCVEGTVEVELVCEPVFDYGRDPWSGRSQTTVGARGQPGPARASR
jgi:hypothetical protein